MKLNINFKRILSSSSSSSFHARTSTMSLLKMCSCVCLTRIFQMHAHVARVCVRVCSLVSALPYLALPAPCLALPRLRRQRRSENTHTKRQAGRSRGAGVEGSRIEGPRGRQAGRGTGMGTGTGMGMLHVKFACGMWFLPPRGAL